MHIDILMWYSEQRVKVRWKSFLSSSFGTGVSNGVRQGGVLSPILFTVYIYDFYWSWKRLVLAAINVKPETRLSN